MKTSIDEQKVIDFYIGLLKQDKLEFLKNNILKSDIKIALQELRKSDNINQKINNARLLWKLLFTAAMSYLDSNKRGYDKLFKYFDEYVKFEELIFASDPFYRDHTLHSIWVYLLGEYLIKSEHYPIFQDHYHFFKNCEYIKLFLLGIGDNDNASKFQNMENGKTMLDSLRCIVALTHDLGYPLKKVEKINESIKKIIPYFSINRFEGFSFNFESLQQSFIFSFLEALCVNIRINVGTEKEVENILAKTLTNEIIDNAFVINGINQNYLDTLTDQQKDIIKKAIGPLIKVEHDIEKKLRFSFDLEQYEHGIMSAFLLVKTVDCFRKFSLSNFNSKLTSDISCAFDPKQEILTAISNHTSKGFQIKGLYNLSEYLILIDEIEEFSRISRADQNRAYISEFCKTSIGMARDGFFEVEFSFDKDIVSFIDAERYFKNKCLKMTRIFNIQKLNPKLCFRLICLDTDNGDVSNTYILEIKNKDIKISKDNNPVNIADYLQSNEY